MKFETKKTGTYLKEFESLKPGDVFYVPADNAYCMKVKDGYEGNYVNAVDLEDGSCYSYKSYEEVVPVTVNATFENPYLQE